MGKVIIDKEEREVSDGDSIQNACEEIGVLFGCQNGFCRTCEITVLEGYENLTKLTENEEFIGLIKPRRLACQCKLLQGTVILKME